jgi:ectoine hydroxylase-related dioxygenase (phytanoyl-CoA dioxygenase family)
LLTVVNLIDNLGVTLITILLLFRPKFFGVTLMSLETLSPNCAVEDIVRAMDRDGACIIRDVLSPQQLQALRTDVMPWIDQTAPSLDDWAGRNTKRTGGLIARCAKVRDLAVNPLILSAANATLSPFCSRIQLNITQLITILPGQAAQPLHRDRFVWGGNDGGGVIPEGIEPQCNGIWAVTDFTEENGATHIVPGSHKWSFKRQARRDESVQAVMKAGSVLLYNGTVIHSGGENRGTTPRIALNITYTLGWLRQEENQYLSCPPEIAKNFDQQLTDLIGYSFGNFALGFYTDPTKTGGDSDILPPESAVGRWPQQLPTLIETDAAVEKA